MDPNAALAAILSALALHERDSAVESLNDLANWLQNGGYMPSVSRVSPEVFEIGTKELTWDG